MKLSANWLRGAVTVLVTLGISAAWAGVVGWIMSVWNLNLTDNSWAYERVFVTDEGRPLVLSSVYGDFGQREEYRTLEGQRLDVQDSSLRNRELYPAALARTPGSRLTTRWWSQRLTMAGDWRQFPGSATWFTIKQLDGRMYLEGFDDASRARIGYIGRKGFRPVLPGADEWFQLDPDKSIYELVAGRTVQAVGSRGAMNEDPDKIIPWCMYFVDDRSLVEVDLRLRTVRHVLADVDVLSLSILSTLDEERTTEDEADDKPYAGQIDRLVLRLQDRLALVDPRTGERADYALPERMRGAEVLGVHGLGGDELYVEVGQVFSSLARRIELVRINRAGEELESHDVELAGWITKSRRQAALENIVPGPVPAGWATAVVGIAPVTEVLAGSSPSYGAALRKLVRDIWPALVLVAAAGVAAAWYVASQQRRLRRKHTAAWTIAALLLGPMLAVVYWLEHRREPRAECASCGRVVPRTREQCAACGGAFPPPALVGTEVFA